MGASVEGEIADAYCCFDQSDLCYKSQVEKNDSGQITRVTKSSLTLSTTLVDVSTHHKRYDFCQANPDDIYCQVDPEGDANTEPEGPACAEDSSCNCGDHHCTVGDCDWHWERSPAAATCATAGSGDSSLYSSSIDAEDGTGQTCTLEVACETERKLHRGGDQRIEFNTVSDSVWNIDDYRNCDGTPREDSCPQGEPEVTK